MKDTNPTQEKRSRRPGGKFSGAQRQSEFDQKVVEIKRVTRVTGGGKRMRFRALVVLGDHKGKVGMGLRKGGDVQESVSKAVNQAKKTMISLPLVSGTIPHEVKVKYKSSQLILRPAKEGTGVIAGGAVRQVCEMAGITNLMCKMVGSANKVNNIKAVFKAFESMKSKEERAKMRSK